VAEGRNLPTPEDKKIQEELCASGDIPRHIAIIMDGNGRWAKQRSLPRVAGHREGVNSVRDIVEASGQLSIEYLTLYAFSTENWKRPQDEVSTLMRLLLNALQDETDRLHRNNVRLMTIGDIEKLPKAVRKELQESIRITKDNTGLTLNLALSYSGRWEIIQAMKEIARKVEKGELHIDDINEAVLNDHLTTAGIPAPDLLIRTGGEYRISNFLLWQLAYSELFISPHYWPDFRRQHLYDAIKDFQHRERRFGMVSEQLRKRNNGGERSFVEKLYQTVSGA
jgi:undecaprenyl diphosphate synthase